MISEKSTQNHHLAIGRCAWDAFATEFYPIYDLRPVWQQIKEKSR
jgi:hypothetical protein